MAQEFAILGKFTGKLSHSKARDIGGVDVAKKLLNARLNSGQFNAPIRDMRKF